MRGFRVLVRGSNIRRKTGADEKSLAFYVVVFVNAREQREAEFKAIESAIVALKLKEGVVPHPLSTCRVEEIYEFIPGFYAQEGAEEFVFFESEQPVLRTTLRGRFWNSIDRCITTVRFRRNGFRSLSPLANDPVLVWELNKGHADVDL